MIVPPDRKRGRGTLAPGLEEGDPPITEEELDLDSTEVTRLFTDQERDRLNDPELQAARAEYHIGDQVEFYGRKYKVYGFKRHADGHLLVVLRLNSEELRRFPTAQKYINIRYPDCLRVLTKRE